MLVLSRKLDEAIIIDGNIRIRVVGIRGNHVRLGIEAPDSVKVFRQELLDRADRELELAGQSANGGTAGGRVWIRPISRTSRGETPPAD
jgi:carbon storage regulator